MKKILIVEDEVIIGLDIASKLSSQGYIVQGQVTTPAEALEAVGNETPDLILMDINLKADIDGIELAKIIKASHNVPCMFLTSYSDKTTLERSMDAEPYGYIIKPYNEATLMASLSTSFIRIDLEQRLIKQKTMLSNIMNNTRDSIVVIDKRGIVVTANKVFNSFVGLADATLEDIEKISGGTLSMDFINRLYSNNISDIATLRINEVDKTTLVSVSSLTDGSGDNILLTITDITEVETIKEALVEAEGRFTKIFRKKMVPAVLIRYPEMQIFEMNESFQTMYGIIKDDATSNDIKSIFGTDVTEQLEVAISADKPVNLTKVKQFNYTDQSFYAHFSGKKVSLDNSDFLLLDVTDVTEQVRIAEMEKELQHKLIHANKMTSLGTLVSGVAHEINNPNNFIMFNSSLLMEFWEDIYALLEAELGAEISVGAMPLKDFKQDVEKLIEGITNGSERIRNIVHDLKGFSKQGNFENFENVSVEEVLKTSSRILNHQISKSTENFRIDIESPLPPVYGNKQKLEQVFINLLMNALEAISGKTSLVSVKAYQSEDNLIVEFQDEGLGISSENISRLTEPFYTTKQQEGGTGLGLSIVYSIVNEHNGTMDIQSVRGKGTIVKITLPLGEHSD